MANVLVVCFSRGGTTRQLALEIAQALEADFEEIEDAAPRAGRLGYVRCLLEAVAKGIPTIRTEHDPKDYDLVILGTPVWAGTLASPVRSYLVRNASRLPRVAFFATMLGHGAKDVLREMKMFCSADDAATLSATAREVVANDYRGKLASFVSDLRGRLPTPTPDAAERAVS